MGLNQVVILSADSLSFPNLWLLNYSGQCIAVDFASQQCQMGIKTR